MLRDSEETVSQSDPQRSAIESSMAETESSGFQGSFVCVQCNEKFSHAETLSSHLLTHAGENPLVCCVCNERFFDHKTLKIHLGIHIGDKTFVCVDCNQLFAKGSFFEHLKLHGQGKRRPVELVESSRRRLNRTDDQPQLKVVAKKVKFKSPTQFPCSVCKKCFHSEQEASDHAETHRRKKHICSRCDSGFSSVKSLREHNRLFIDGPLYACSECGVKFCDSGAFKDHLRLLHKISLLWPCDKCDQLYARKVHLNEHLALEHQDYRTLKCPHCKRRFPSATLLKNHVKIHSFACLTCGEHFALKDSLIIHYNTVHGVKRFRSGYVCRHCEKVFTKESDLKSHIMCAHPYKCSYCAETFETHEDHTNHMLSHSTNSSTHSALTHLESDVILDPERSPSDHLEEPPSENSLECFACGSRFVDWISMDRHYKEVHSMYEAMCGLCPRQLSQHGSLIGRFHPYCTRIIVV